MAVPKKKMSKSRSNKRFKTWVKINSKRISNSIKLITCKSCGAKIKAHNVCPECGYYKNKQIINKNKNSINKKITAAKV